MKIIQKISIYKKTKLKCEIVDIFFAKAYYYLARFKKTYLEGIDRVKKQLID